MKQVEAEAQEELLTRLESCIEEWQRLRKALFKRYNITSSQLKVLRVVAANKRQHAPNQQSIADSTGMNKMVVSQTLDALHKKLLLTRIKDPIDNRQYTIRLGSGGKGLLEKITPEVIELEREFLDELVIFWRL